MSAPGTGSQTSKRHPNSDADTDADGKPDSPQDLRSTAWRFALKRTWREYSDDQCTDLAAALTYYAVLSVFPAAAALISLLGVFGQSADTIDSLLKIGNDLGAGSVTDSIRGPLEQLASSQAAGPALIIGLLTALWSASGYVGAFGRAMNRVYEVGEGRPFWKLRPLQMLVTLIAVALIGVVAVGLVVTGPLADAIGKELGLGGTVVTVWSIAKWPVLAAVVVVVIAILYYATPNVKQPKFRWISVGAALALLVWVVASAAFGLYVANFGNYNKTYGTLAGAVVFLLWLWLTNLALLFGAELDAELERSRQLQAGLPAERDIQLPARDERVLRKKEATEKRDLAQAEAIKRGEE
jgi:membrane protein